MVGGVELALRAAQALLGFLEALLDLLELLLGHDLLLQRVGDHAVLAISRSLLGGRGRLLARVNSVDLGLECVALGLDGRVRIGGLLQLALGLADLYEQSLELGLGLGNLLLKVGQTLARRLGLGIEFVDLGLGARERHLGLLLLLTRRSERGLGLGQRSLGLSQLDGSVGDRELDLGRARWRAFASASTRMGRNNCCCGVGLGLRTGRLGRARRRLGLGHLRLSRRHGLLGLSQVLLGLGGSLECLGSRVIRSNLCLLGNRQ